MKEKPFEREVLDRLIAIETKLDTVDMKTVRDDSLEALNLSKENKCDITEMKDNNKWVWRTIVGSIILWVLSVIYNTTGK